MAKSDWDLQVEKLTPLQQKLSMMGLDVPVSVLVNGEWVHGFVAETEDPNIFHLLEAVEVSWRELTEDERNEGCPHHRVVGHYCIDINEITAFKLAHKPVMLCVHEEAK